MKILIIKLGAAGDVIRTSSLLNLFNDDICWLTSDSNTILLKDSPRVTECISWSQRHALKNGKYDLVINLEDSIDASLILEDISYRDLFGACLNKSGKLVYTESSKEWFDLSLISRFGKEKADMLKLENRKTYQEMIFSGLGYRFTGDKYYIPPHHKTDLKGDIAIADKSGAVWPMKNWHFYHELKELLIELGYAVNYLPIRESMLEHIGDIKNHKLLIGGDSLPMHLAIGSGIKCITLFNCTSPWEIYDYGLQKKIVSPDLAKYFYKRHYDEEATKSISLKVVYEEAVRELPLAIEVARVTGKDSDKSDKAASQQ
jgi:heptosyltransferase II